MLKDGHVITIEKGRYLCPIDQGSISKLLHSPTPGWSFSQVVTEWRFVLFLPYWHAHYVATLLESDEPVFGNIHRLTMRCSPAPHPSTVAIQGRSENGYVVEAVDCDIKEFLPSTPYMLAVDALKTAFETAY